MRNGVLGKIIRIIGFLAFLTFAFFLVTWYGISERGNAKYGVTFNPVFFTIISEIAVFFGSAIASLMLSLSFAKERILYFLAILSGVIRKTSSGIVIFDSEMNGNFI